MHQISLLKHALPTYLSPGIDIDITPCSWAHYERNVHCQSLQGGQLDNDHLPNALSHNSFTLICKQLEGILTSTKDGITFDGLKACLRHLRFIMPIRLLLLKRLSLLLSLRSSPLKWPVWIATSLIIQKTSASILAVVMKGAVHVLMQRKRRILFLLPRQILWGRPRLKVKLPTFPLLWHPQCPIQFLSINRMISSMKMTGPLHAQMLLVVSTG